MSVNWFDPDDPPPPSFDVDPGDAPTRAVLAKRARRGGVRPFDRRTTVVEWRRHRWSTRERLYAVLCGIWGLGSLFFVWWDLWPRYGAAENWTERIFTVFIPGFFLLLPAVYGCLHLARRSALVFSDSRCWRCKWLLFFGFRARVLFDRDDVSAVARENRLLSNLRESILPGRGAAFSVVVSFKNGRKLVIGDAPFDAPGRDWLARHLAVWAQTAPPDKADWPPTEGGG